MQAGGQRHSPSWHASAVLKSWAASSPGLSSHILIQTLVCISSHRRLRPRSRPRCGPLSALMQTLVAHCHQQELNHCQLWGRLSSLTATSKSLDITSSSK